MNTQYRTHSFWHGLADALHTLAVTAGATLLVYTVASTALSCIAAAIEATFF